MPSPCPVIVVHYDELALKSGNRKWFEQQLLREMRAACGPLDVRRRYGRFVMTPSETGPTVAEMVGRLVHLPGIRYLLEGLDARDAIEDILAAAEATLPETPALSFAVKTRRVDKTHPLDSPEISRRVGHRVLELRPGWRVDLKNPEHRIHIEVLNRKALVCQRRHEAPGGLPVGVSGRGVALLSGGIDSPVAAHRMLVRGLRLGLIHFHSAPFTTTASQDKVRELVTLLQRAQPAIDLLMVPFADPIQQAIVQGTPERFRVILYRRFMMRLAHRAAVATKASCVVTGEALGQVASQTIENLTTVEAVCRLPVLRPLIGSNKSEIIEEAQRLGTFEVSIRPHEDCCSFLMPQHPATHSTAEELAEVEAGLDVDDLVERTWKASIRERFRP